MNIILDEIGLGVDIDSARREKISDEEYFSSKYNDFISNSRLKLINPDQLGSPGKFKAGFTGEMTKSLNIGSSIHQLLLQPSEFFLGPDIGKPPAKLGLVIDEIFKLRKRGLPIYSCILQACELIHYYENCLTPSKIRSIIKKGLEYYYGLKLVDDNKTIILSTKDRDTVESCIYNLTNNRQVINLLYPIDNFGDPITSTNEDAFFINVNGFYKNKVCKLRLKMKADNWSIDPKNKIVILNDLKTTGHGILSFMEHGGSFETFHYSRQFAFYLWILKNYCKKEFNLDNSWNLKCNVIVVETIMNHNVQVYSINNKLLQEGYQEFLKLLKMVAYCEMFGYSNDIKFV